MKLDEASEAVGHSLLREWFEAEPSRTYAGLARMLRKNPQTVASWCSRNAPTRPSSIADMCALQVLTGTPMNAWLEPAEEAWLGEVTEGRFNSLFERPRRATRTSDSQLHFDSLLPNAPQPPPAAPMDLEGLL